MITELGNFIMFFVIAGSGSYSYCPFWRVVEPEFSANFLNEHNQNTTKQHQFRIFLEDLAFMKVLLF